MCLEFDFDFPFQFWHRERSTLPLPKTFNAPHSGDRFCQVYSLANLAKLHVFQNWQGPSQVPYVSLKSPRKIDKMVISDDVSVQVNLLTIISIMTISTHPQMQKITMRFEEPPILEKQSEKEQMALQRQQLAAAAGCLNWECLKWKISKYGITGQPLMRLRLQRKLWRVKYIVKFL